MDILKIKKDKFLKQRGGTTKIIDIFCRKCGKLLLVYQKDGPGWLKRLYLNRILKPEEYSKLQLSPRIKNASDLNKLVCKCGNIIGIPAQHVFRSDGITPDGRLDFELMRGKFIRKMHK